MEIQAIVEHEPPDKGVEWEAQSAEEMGEEYHPLMGPGGYCRRSGNGGPQTCLPAAHGVALQAGPYGPSVGNMP